MELRTATVTGMSSPSTAQQVESLLADIDGVVRVSADHDTGTVEVVVTDNVRTDKLKAAICTFQE
ncbi:MAG: heavy-metal-associated domain-containing protein [Halobacteriales archaeon]